MENLIWITGIIGGTVFFTVGVWKLFDWCKLKKELEHRKELEKMRLKDKKKMEKLKVNFVRLEKFKQKVKKELDILIENSSDDKLKNKAQNIYDKLDLINSKTEK